MNRPVLSTDEMGHHLGDAGTSWLYVHNDILPKARKAMEKHRNIKVRNGFGLTSGSLMSIIMFFHAGLCGFLLI